MNLYEEQFSDSLDFQKVDKASKFLVIASTGRCGSHMLGHALHATGQFGFPLEYAHPSNVAEWKRRLAVQDLDTLMVRLQQKRTSPNGVFSIKVHYPHIKQFGSFAQLQSVFPNAHYVLLSRHDVLKQAVSLSIASQTGVWIAGQKPRMENPEYNFEHINNCLKRTILNNASWRYCLAASGSQYIELDFDSVKDQLAGTIGRIAEFMGVQVLPEQIPSQQVTKKQSNPLNKEWEQRFIEEFSCHEELTQSTKEKLKQSIKQWVPFA